MQGLAAYLRLYISKQYTVIYVNISGQKYKTTFKSDDVKIRTHIENKYIAINFNVLL